MSSKLLNLFKELIGESWTDTNEEQLPKIKDKITSEINSLLREVRIEKDSKKIIRLETLRKFFCFMDYAIDHYKNRFWNYPYLILLDWLLQEYSIADQDSKKEIAEEVTIIFKEFLDKNIYVAYKYYLGKKSDLGEITPRYSILVNQFILFQKLQYQSNVKDILSLLEVFFEDPCQFTAALLCLLKKHVSAEEIIQSGLLHRFVAYHFSMIQSLDSVVHTVFKLLKLFDSFAPVNTLVSQAQLVSCDQRGFENITLTGEKGQLELKKVQIIPPKINITLDENNFDNLYALFGVNLLEQALEQAINYSSKDKKNKLENGLEDLINRSGALDQIPQLLDIISWQGPGKKFRMFKILAKVVWPNKGKRILKNNSKVIYLAKYQPLFLTLHTRADLESYFNAMVDSRHTHSEQLSQLNFLIQYLQEHSLYLQTVLLEQIVDKVLLHPELVLNFNSLITGLQKLCALSQRSITNRLNNYWQSLNDFIISKIPNFTAEVYGEIEDLWSIDVAKVNLLRRILPQETSYPLNKYALRAQITNIYSRMQGVNFDLNPVVDAMITPFSDQERRRNEKERTLIDIILTIEDNNFQKTIMTCLQNQDVTKDYVAIMLNRVVEQQNISLLSFILDETCASDVEKTQLIHAILLHSITNMKWKIVEFLCTFSGKEISRMAIVNLKGIVSEVCILLIDDKLKEETIVSNLRAATVCKDISAISFVCHLSTKLSWSAFKKIMDILPIKILQDLIPFYLRHITLEMASFCPITSISNLSTKAVRATLIEILEDLSNKRSQVSIPFFMHFVATERFSFLFKKFTATKKWQLVRWLINNFESSRPIIEETFKRAVYLVRFKTVVTLCSLSKEKRPSEDCIITGIKSLLSKYDAEFQKKNSTKFREKRKLFHIILFLFPMISDHQESSLILDQLLILFANDYSKKNLCFLKALFSLSGDKKPNQQVVSIAFGIAVRNNAWNIVKYIAKNHNLSEASIKVEFLNINKEFMANLRVVCNRFTMPALINILMEAANAGEIDWICSICSALSYHAYDTKYISQALEMAFSSKQWHCVIKLISNYQISISRSVVETILSKAVSLLCDSEQPEFAISSREQLLSIVQTICSLTGGSKPTNETLLQIKVIAKGNNQNDILSLLPSGINAGDTNRFFPKTSGCLRESASASSLSIQNGRSYNPDYRS